KKVVTVNKTTLPINVFFLPNMSNIFAEKGLTIIAEESMNVTTNPALDTDSHNCSIKKIGNVVNNELKKANKINCVNAKLVKLFVQIFSSILAAPIVCFPSFSSDFL